MSFLDSGTPRTVHDSWNSVRLNGLQHSAAGTSLVHSEALSVQAQVCGGRGFEEGAGQRSYSTGYPHSGV